LHTVEVTSFCGDVIAAFSNIMNWLASRGSQAAISRQVDGHGTAFRLGSAAKRRHWPSFTRSAAGWFGPNQSQPNLASSGSHPATMGRRRPNRGAGGTRFIGIVHVLRAALCRSSML
jgi:hypothetical protein